LRGDSRDGGPGRHRPVWHHFGADRFANNGDSNIGFWFFRSAISLGGPPNATKATPFTGIPCPSGATNCLPGELHRNGDVLIVSAFTQGGAIGSIIVFEWQNGALVQTLNINAAHCTPNSPSHSPACAIINTSPVPAPPDWQYVPKAGAANSYPTGSFFERHSNAAVGQLPRLPVRRLHAPERPLEVAASGRGSHPPPLIFFLFLFRQAAPGEAQPCDARH